MSCNVCCRKFGSDRMPTCASCIAATLYEPRIHHANHLLDRDKHHTFTEAIACPGNDGILATLPEDADWDVITAGVKAHSYANAKLGVAANETRVAVVNGKSRLLQQQIDELAVIVKRRRTAHERRKRELEYVREQLEHEAPKALETLRHANLRLISKLEKTLDKIVDARTYLCREACLLRGLKLRKRKSRDGSTKDEYWISGLPIPDLREFNAHRPEIVSAALAHICRLLTLICVYLSIRLPAEVTLPHAGFPHPVVLRERDSYQGSTAQNFGSSDSSGSSIVNSRQLDKQEQTAPRSRALYLDRALSRLYKDDRKGYNLFVEAIGLLSWDVAWLCKAQGSLNVTSFDEFCMIGRNLFGLVHRTHLKSRKQLPPGSHEVLLSGTPTGKAAKFDYLETRFGVLSHKSTDFNPTDCRGIDMFRGWPLLSASALTRLNDELSRYLLGEMGGAEWDILAADEWESADHNDEGVVTREMQIAGNIKQTAARRPYVKPMQEDEYSRDNQQIGKSGWMKVRERGNGL